MNQGIVVFVKIAKQSVTVGHQRFADNWAPIVTSWIALSGLGSITQTEEDSGRRDLIFK